MHCKMSVIKQLSKIKYDERDSWMGNMHAEVFNMSSRLCSKLQPQLGVSFSCACPVMDNEFRHNIVQVAVGPRDDS